MVGKSSTSFKRKLRKRLIKRDYGSSLELLDEMVKRGVYGGDSPYAFLLRGALLYLSGNREESKEVLERVYFKFLSSGEQGVRYSVQLILERLFGSGSTGDRKAADLVVDVLPDLKDLPGDDLKYLFDVSRVKSYRKGEFICREGEAARDFFIILEGEVSITRGGLWIGHASKGDVIGEMALFGFGGKRSADVVASTDVEVLAVPYDALKPPSKEGTPGVFEKLRAIFERRAKESAVLSSKFFRDLPLRKRKKIIGYSELVYFPKGFELSGPSLSDFLYVLADGKASVLVVSGGTLDVLRGDVFGGPSLRDGKVLFVEDSCAVKVPWSRIEEFTSSLGERVKGLERTGVYREPEKKLS